MFALASLILFSFLVAMAAIIENRFMSKPAAVRTKARIVYASITVVAIVIWMAGVYLVFW